MATNLFGTTSNKLTSLDNLKTTSKKLSTQQVVIPTLIDQNQVKSTTPDTTQTTTPQTKGETEYKGLINPEFEKKDIGSVIEKPPERKYDIKYITEEDVAALGLDSSWIGLPFQMGYTDAEGNWVTVRDLMSQATKLHDLANLQGPNIIDITQTPEWQSIQDLTNQLQSEAQLQADYDAGLAQFERMIGLDPGEFSTMIGGMIDQLNLGITGQTGLTAGELQAWDRSTGTQLQKMGEENKMLLESLSHSGRSVETFQAADQISRNMADFRNQRELDKLNTDYLRKQTEYEALNTRMTQLLQSGLISTQQYQETMTQNRVLALQSYAQQITALSEQNQTEIAAYSAHAQVMYNSIMADIGVSESLLNQASEYYEMYMAPYYADLQAAAIEQEQAALAEQQKSQFWGNVLSIGGFILFAVGGGTVICTELCNQGYMTEEMKNIDMEFGKEFMIKYPKIYNGYIQFATPIVNLMKKSKLFTCIVNIVVKPWHKEMAYQMGYYKKGSFIGRLLMKAGIVICGFLGRRKYGMAGR